jgi:hypothetical protein
MPPGRPRRGFRNAIVVGFVAIPLLLIGPEIAPVFATVTDAHPLAWAATEGLLPADASTAQYSPNLDAVVCHGRRSCVAVGNYTDTSGGDQGLIETLADGTATAREASLPGNAATTNPNAAIIGLSCPTEHSCVGVGQYVDSRGVQQGLVETLASGTWTATEAPQPANASTTQYSSVVYGITCRTVGFCIGTGTYVDSSGNDQGLIETLSGITWNATEAPLPPNASTVQYAVLRDVVCPAVGSCVALGNYHDSITNDQGFVDNLSGGTWTPTETPLPDNNAVGSEGSLNHLACVKLGRCVAEGSYTATTGGVQGLIDTLSGGTWTAHEAQLPGDAATANQGADLTDVSCSSPAFCVGVGQYVDANAALQGLVETRSGPNFTPSQAPVLANAAPDPGAALAAVACVGNRFCAAVGGFRDTHGTLQGLIETRSGGTWTASDAPLPANAATNPKVSLLNVACSNAGSCMALGAYTDMNGNERSLIEIS